MSTDATQRAAAPRRTPESRAEEIAHLSLGARLLLALLLPVRLLLMPLGIFFRIREPLPLVLRATMPLLLIAALIGLWYMGTRGEFYLTRLAKLSALDERKAEIEKRLGAPVQLETQQRERKLFTGQRMTWAEIVSVTAPAGVIDQRRAEIDALFGRDQYDVEGGTRLKARSHFGKVDGTSEYDKALRRLQEGIPGIALETRERVEAGPDGDHIVVLVDRALLPEGTSGTAVLDEVFGAESYVRVGRVLTGTERVEERPISAALLPSPHEMLDSLPSLLNQRWNTWDDARSWWRSGNPEAGQAAAAPLTLDWSKWNEVPFALVDGALARLIGPSWKDWKLLHAITWSTLRIVVGFFWAALLAVPLGVVMGSFTKPRVLFEPLRLMGSYLPLPAFLPLTVFWWGMGESQKIGFLAIASFVVLLPQVIMAVEAIPQVHIDAARTFGATRWQIMRHVLLSGAKADIAQSLRLSFAVGWTWIILAEMINPVAGLGWVIQLGERRPAHRPHIYAVVLLIVLLAYVVNTVWALIERRLYPYREEA